MSADPEEKFTVESRANANSITAYIGLALFILATSSLLILSLLNFAVPHVISKSIHSLLPLGWIVWIFVILSSGTAPRFLRLNNEGIRVQIWWSDTFLAWSDIDAVREHRYHLFIYSRKLPIISYITGVLLFRFRPLFTINSRRENY